MSQYSRRLLPLVSLRLDGCESLERSNALIRDARDAEDHKDNEKDESRSKNAADGFKHWFVTRPSPGGRGSVYFDTGNRWSSATFSVTTFTRGSPRKPRSAPLVDSVIACFT